MAKEDKVEYQNKDVSYYKTKYLDVLIVES